MLLPADLWSRRRYGAMVIMAVLVLGVQAAVAGRVAARPLAPSGSPAGDCLAVLEAVTAGLRERFPQLAAVSAHEVAAPIAREPTARMGDLRTQAAMASRQRSRRPRTCTHADISCAVPSPRTQGIVSDRVRRA